MKVISEISLTSFEFWGRAKDRAKILTYEELEQIGKVLQQIYEEIKDITINKLFWFGFAWCCESIGIKHNKENNIIIIRKEESKEE